MDESLSLRLENIKLLEKRSTFFDIGLGNIFFNVSLGKRKAKINKQDYIKLESFCTLKDTINKTKYDFIYM